MIMESKYTLKNLNLTYVSRGYESLTQQLRIALSYLDQRLKQRTKLQEKNNDHVHRKRKIEYLEQQFAEGIGLLRKI